jgi:hypothetical protein
VGRNCLSIVGIAPIDRQAFMREQEEVRGLIHKCLLGHLRNLKREETTFCPVCFEESGGQVLNIGVEVLVLMSEHVDRKYADDARTEIQA